MMHSPQVVAPVARIAVVLVLGLLSVAPACADASSTADAPDAAHADEPADGRPVVLTTFRPTTDFARRIAGDLVDVRCPVPEGEDPIFWQPSRDDLAQYRAADLVIVNGAEFEKWVATASLPSSRVIDTAAGFREQWLAHAGSVTHSHGGTGAHAHEGVDGHTWLDPILARRQAEAIAEAFARARPQHAAAFSAGMRSLAAQLEVLDGRWTSLAPDLRGRRVLASHPAYDYVARRYDFTIVNLLLDPDAAWDEQTAALVADALARAEIADGGTSAGGAPAMPALLLWEAPPHAEVAESLRSRFGVVSVVVTPAENPSPAELAGGRDSLALFAENLDRLEAALRDR